MSDPITGEVLQVIAGKIEEILIEQAEGISFSYGKLNTLKISISVNIDPILDGVEVDYQISYPLEPKPDPATKQVVKYHGQISTAQADLLSAIDNFRPSADSGIESVTISSGDKSVTLERKAS